MQSKAYFLFVINLITLTKEYYKHGRRLKICETIHYVSITCKCELSSICHMVVLPNNFLISAYWSCITIIFHSILPVSFPLGELINYVTVHYWLCIKYGSIRPKKNYLLFLRHFFEKRMQVWGNYGHDSLNKKSEVGVKKTKAPVPEKQKIIFLGLTGCV